MRDGPQEFYQGGQAGPLALAEGGMLCLDELGDLSKQMQMKLLRVPAGRGV
jgi:transcriptional regulator with PAS, ATPase and Fis domain